MADKDAALAALHDTPDRASRDVGVMRAIRAGAELDETGFAAGVTRERIRQIVRETAAQIDFEPRDLLADVLAVCRDAETAVWLAEVPRRLRALAPDHPPYWAGMGLFGTRLGGQLEREGVRVVRRDGRPVKFHVASLRAALLSVENAEDSTHQ